MTTIISQWTVESVRCSGFPIPNVDIDPTNWWADMVGKQPDQITTQPVDGKYLAHGSMLGGALQLLVQPLRIQWTLSPNPSDKQGQDWQVPNVGGIEQVSEFLEIAKNWLGVAPSLSRLAFGAVLINVVEDRKAGYDQLNSFLPGVEIDSTEMRDLLYQVNRRRSSDMFEGVQINRLSKWSIAEISPITIQIEGGQQGVKSAVGQPVSTLRLELDINNVPDPEYTFESDSAVTLFNELTDMGLEISKSGDIQ